MNILVIGPSINNSKGGMSTVIQEMYEDTTLCNKYNIGFYESYVDGNKIKVLLYSVIMYIKFVLFGIGKKYDVYHIHVASYGSFFRKRLYIKTIKKHNGKIILHVHGAEFLKFYENLSQKHKNIVVNTMNEVNMVIALSNEWKQHFESVFGINNCVVLENGINMNGLKSAIVKPEDYKNSLLFLGRLGHRKGTYDLVEAIDRALKTLPNVQLYIAGDGEIDEIKRLICDKKLNDSIEVIGWADYETKVELLKKVSTVVLPSYNEGLPMTILEGMACGKAIISTSVGAIPEVVKTDNGIIIEPGDIDALANAIIKCCSDINYLNKVSNNNINKIRDKYSVEIMHERLVDYYDEVFEL